jgi:hypothetical protein
MATVVLLHLPNHKPKPAVLWARRRGVRRLLLPSPRTTLTLTLKRKKKRNETQPAKEKEKTSPTSPVGSTRWALVRRGMGVFLVIISLGLGREVSV